MGTKSLVFGMGMVHLMLGSAFWAIVGDNSATDGYVKQNMEHVLPDATALSGFK